MRSTGIGASCVLRRRLLAATLLAGTAAAMSCGGGGGGGGGPSAVPLAGKVTLRDGSALDLGGVQVVLAETGASATTGADGTFSFSCAAGSDVHLQFHDPLAPAQAVVAPSASVECALPADGGGVSFPHSDEIDGDEVRLDSVLESIGVEVTLDAGVVTSLRTTRGGGTVTPDDQGVVPMTSVGGSLATGTLTLYHVFGGGFQLRIEAFGLPPSSELEIALEPPLDIVSTSPCATNDCGATRQIFVFGGDGVAEDDPTGWTVRVRAPGGADILVGTVPVAGTEIVP